MKHKLIIIGLCIILFIGLAQAGTYTPPDLDNVSLEFDTGYSAPAISDVPLVFGDAVTDTCSPTGSENHVMSCSDGCNITTDLDMGNFNLTFNESGTITFDANLSNVNVLLNDGNSPGCVVVFNQNIN